MVHQYTLFVLLLIYIIQVVQFLRVRNKIPASGWVLSCMLLWPLLLLEEWLRMSPHAAAPWLSGLTVFLPVLCITLLYRATKPLVIDKPQHSKMLMWVPVIIASLAQLPLTLSSVVDKMAWLQSSPVGEPLLYWPVYLVYMIAGFGVLVMGILTAEMVQNYHRHLPDQAVDIWSYQIRWLGAALGICVGLAFCCILLVTASTFGFLHIPFWQSMLHILFAIAILLIIIAICRPQRTSPSPLDYERLDELRADNSSMRNALNEADKKMAEQESYLIEGLQLKAFARQCQVEPTTLTIALRLLKKQDFRTFVLSYRKLNSKTPAQK